MERVVIAGHSFVRRLEYDGVTLGLRTAEEEYHGYLGLERLNCIAQLLHEREEFMDQIDALQVLVLIMGTNDIIHHCDATPETIAEGLVEVAVACLNRGAQRIILVEAFPRFGPAVSTGHALEFVRATGLVEVPDLEVEFAKRVERFNGRLEEAAGVTQGLTFLRVKGLHFCTEASLQTDGLHLNALGVQRLRAALRKAVVVDLQRAQGMVL